MTRFCRPTDLGVVAARALVVLLLAGVATSLACAPLGCRGGAEGEPASQGVTAPKATPGPAAPVRPAAPARNGPRVTVNPTGGPPVTLAVEVVTTPGARARGLMFRQELAEDSGMLFVFPVDGDYPFYMRNTYVPLDIIYLDEGGRVVGVLQDMKPLDETPRSVGRPARFVLEVNGGLARSWGLAVGDTTELPSLSGLEVY